MVHFPFFTRKQQLPKSQHLFINSTISISSLGVRVCGLAFLKLSFRTRLMKPLKSNQICLIDTMLSYLLFLFILYSAKGDLGLYFINSCHLGDTVVLSKLLLVGWVTYLLKPLLGPNQLKLVKVNIFFPLPVPRWGKCCINLIWWHSPFWQIISTYIDVLILLSATLIKQPNLQGVVKDLGSWRSLCELRVFLYPQREPETVWHK